VADSTITVYTRNDCHLCEDALTTIHWVRDSVSTDVALKTVNVDEDPELREKYGDRVPYVLVDDRPAFKYRVDATALRELLSE
jgi:glutaredoxin